MGKGSFEVRRHTLDLDHLRSEDPPQSRATPFGGSPHKRAQKKEAFAFCRLALTLPGKSVYAVLRHYFTSMTLTSSEFKQRMKTY